MLRYLRITDFAIVEQLELQLETGLTIITGETGAGKSILIDALGLVLGERANSSIVRQGCEHAQVIAHFNLSAPLLAWLQQQGLNKADTCQVKRVVYPNGRSRAYINQQPVAIQLLRTLGEQLIDIHGQHAHQSLLKQDQQRQLLDTMIEDNAALKSVQSTYYRWKSLRATLDELGAQDREAQLTLLRYQVQELTPFELTPTAIEQLEQDHRRLANAQKLLDNSQQALRLLDTEEGYSIVSYLAQAEHALSEAQQHDQQISTAKQLVENAVIQIQEAVSELRRYVNEIDIDPTGLQAIEQQIATLQDLARKHKIRFAELPAHFEQLKTRLHTLEHQETQVNQLETELAEVLQHYQTTALVLHQQRDAQAQQLAAQISTYLHQLGMPDGQLHITVTTDETIVPTSKGIDKVNFLVSTNPGILPKPLAKVASGGELSRISLAIQVITAQSNGVPILVFDEVDVGIGGSVAEVVGRLLNQLGQQRQVLCITHLPQVAVHGHHHLQVRKLIKAKKTHTYIKQLTQQERVEEIARMLGGMEITGQTLAHAEEMLQQGNARLTSIATQHPK